MEHHLFSVYDTKAGAYLPIFQLPAIGMATRTFSDCVNDPTHAFGMHPADYTLFKLGTFDDLTCEIVVEVITLGIGLQFIKEKQT